MGVNLCGPHRSVGGHDQQSCTDPMRYAGLDFKKTTAPFDRDPSIFAMEGEQRISRIPVGSVVKKCVESRMMIVVYVNDERVRHSDIACVREIPDSGPTHVLMKM